MYDVPSAQIHNGDTLRFCLAPQQQPPRSSNLSLFENIFSRCSATGWNQLVGVLNDCFWPLTAGEGYEACWSSTMQTGGQVSAITRPGLKAPNLLKSWLR